MLGAAVASSVVVVVGRVASLTVAAAVDHIASAAAVAEVEVSVSVSIGYQS